MSIFANPLNTALLPPILYLLYRIFFPSYPKKVSPASSHNDAYNWSPKAHLPIVCKRKFSVKELEPFNGRDGPGSSGDGRILLAIARIVDGRIKERTVFDVTKGRNFYGPDGMYGNFAGRDASRGMAKQSFDEEMLTDINKPMDTLSDLTKAEIENMHGWHDHFSGKYIVVGELVE